MDVSRNSFTKGAIKRCNGLPCSPRPQRCLGKAGCGPQCPGLDDKAVFGHRLDTMSPEI